MQQRSRLSRWLRRSVWLLLALIIAPIAAVALLVGRVWLGQPELDGERHGSRAWRGGDDFAG